MITLIILIILAVSITCFVHEWKRGKFRRPVKSYTIDHMSEVINSIKKRYEDVEFSGTHIPVAAFYSDGSLPEEEIHTGAAGGDGIHGSAGSSGTYHINLNTGDKFTNTWKNGKISITITTPEQELSRDWDV